MNSLTLGPQISWAEFQKYFSESQQFLAEGTMVLDKNDPATVFLNALLLLPQQRSLRLHVELKASLNNVSLIKLEDDANKLVHGSCENEDGGFIAANSCYQPCPEVDHMMSKIVPVKKVPVPSEHDSIFFVPVRKFSKVLKKTDSKKKKLINGVKPSHGDKSRSVAKKRRSVQALISELLKIFGENPR